MDLLLQEIQLYTELLLYHLNITYRHMNTWITIIIVCYL